MSSPHNFSDHPNTSSGPERSSNSTAILIVITIAIVCGTLMLVLGGFIVRVMSARPATQEATRSPVYSHDYVTLVREGRYREGLQSLDQALINLPVDAHVHNLKAWLLATCSDDEIRDGTLAVKHANRACELTQWDNAAFVDTLAAAYAEAGDFDSAVVYQKSAICLDDGTETAGSRERLELYRLGHPYREDYRTQSAILPEGVVLQVQSESLSSDSLVDASASVEEADAAAQQVASDIKSGRELRRFEGHSSEAVFGLAFTPSGRHIISAGSDEVLRMWDVNSGEEVRVFNGHTDGVGCLAISTDGTRVLSGSWDLSMRLWDQESGKEIREYRGHEWPVLTVAISPDGKRALSGSDGFRLWDLQTGEILWHDQSHAWTVWSVTFSPDGQRALTGSWDESVRLWDLSATSALGRRLRALPFDGRIKCVRFDPQGRFFAAAATIGTNRLGVWDLETLQRLPGFEGHRNGIGWVEFSPDGTRVASTSGRQNSTNGGYCNDLPDQTVRVWEVATGREIVRLEGHTAFVSGVAFSPDGKLLASSAADGTARVWELP